MRARYPLSIILLCAAIVMGREPNFGDGPFGPPDSSKLLEPLAGKWIFDEEKTLAALRAAGAPAKEIEERRKAYKTDPKTAKYPDLAIKGNVAVGNDLPSSELRFFRMHKHGKKICGRAWHHEDRHDPGDMSKCYVKLELVGDTLQLDLFMIEDPPELTDPDLANGPPVEAPEKDCDLDKKTTKNREDWITVVFHRG